MVNDWATTTSFVLAWGVLLSLWERIQLAYAGASAWLRVRLCTAKRRDDWAVYRVYVFEDPTEHPAEDPAEDPAEHPAEHPAPLSSTVDDPAEDPAEDTAPRVTSHTLDEHKFHELPARFFNPDTWEDDARDATGWTRLRVEVRYRVSGATFRMVLRPGDTCAFPPPPRARGFPLSILAANLRGRGVNVDVTRRVLKYQGATLDFHGTVVKVRDMFPFDDQGGNAERFSHLQVIDSLARTRAIPYLSDESVAPPPLG